MKVKHSKFTYYFLKLAYERYGELGLFWGPLILLTCCYVVSPEKYLLMKWSYSGQGKTISDKVALFFLENGKDEVPYLILSARLTPAGISKLLKKEKISVEEFKKAKLILFEDLSKASTPYLQKTAVAFLASLTESKTLDDVTYDGAGFGLVISNEKKKAMLSGTPAQFEFLSSQDIYTEYIDRRSLSLFLLMSPEEWNYRKERAKKEPFEKDQERIIEEWKRLIVEAYKLAGIEKLQTPPDRFIQYDSPTRQAIFEKMLTFKRYPENLMMMIDSLAKGHAMLNGRNCTIEEDYQVIDKIFGRFLYIGSVRKKEFLIMEELSFHGGTMPIDTLVKILEERSRRENLREAKLVRNTIQNYCQYSKFLEYTVVPAKIKGGHGAQEIAIVSLTKELKLLLENSRKELRELING